MKKEISFVLNGTEATVMVDRHYRLLDILRGPLAHTGTKEGCGKGECGTCTVIVEGQAVNSCLYPAHEVDGKSVITIEGVHGLKSQLSPIQKSFVEHGAIQCGFCTPGMIISAKALLDVNPSPSEEEIRDALAGNLCRCTGYAQIIEAVKHASLRLKGKS